MKQGIIIVLLAAAVLTGFSFSKTPQKITKERLGEMLFFDPILSEDSSISCASCHKPAFAFADTVAFSTGVHGRLATRNTPSAMNVSAREALFWDGRATTLEQQALGPIENPNEMNLPLAEAVKRLNRSKKYRHLFFSIFKSVPNQKYMAEAIAAYERTLETSSTPNDRWLNDEPNGMTEQQVRGRDIFRVKAKCFECHFTPDFTADEFRSIGLFNGTTHNDSGRYLVTRNPADIGKMKVPGLRNVAVTAPYMHDGSFKTLREVIDYYDNPHVKMPDGINRDTVLRQPLGLTEQEKQDLEAFLHALTDDKFVKRK
ncbi:cytochrome-c peroxidase [Chitinophagaceae bacterium IBVUCB1]|nr:cytochrome-c peroxidase [Chitinophagaceae bacterium IBVUCB1]